LSPKTLTHTIMRRFKNDAPKFGLLPDAIEKAEICLKSAIKWAIVDGMKECLEKAEYEVQSHELRQELVRMSESICPQTPIGHETGVSEPQDTQGK
jgi:hypothetical protein